jgi:signal transduction histidine kinase
MLAAIGVTVAIVIALYTFFVHRVQSEWWRERTQAQNVITATMVHEYLAGVMLSDRHQEVLHFLQQLQSKNEIWRGRVIKVDGTIVFSTTTQEMKHATLATPPELFREKHILHGVRVEDGHQIAIAMYPIQNRASCAHCHDDKKELLGAIVLERSLEPAVATVARNRNLLLLYGALIFVIVGVVVWLLIVRLVAQPVHNLLAQMERVRAGDLTARVPAQSHDEIGRLTDGFNSMVESLQKTTEELRESHERQIQQAGKLASIGELASGIAHEIRNPLAGIGAAVEVLAESAKDREIVGEIRKQINRLSATLRGLLDFSRPSEPEIMPCDVGELLKPMLALTRPDAQKANVQIITECPDNLPPISADPQQLQQAILNILLNAIQAMPHGGTLTVRTDLHVNRLRLSIRDTGVGIPRENRERIFSPFFTTKHHGTGLGLAITRSIIEKNGGTIAVESEVGRGTTVFMEFPVSKQEASDAKNQSAGH